MRSSTSAIGGRCRAHISARMMIPRRLILKCGYDPQKSDQELTEAEPDTDDEVEHDEIDEETGAIWRTSNKRKLMFAPLDVSPLFVYKALKGKYGPPNSSSDETKSQWSYKITGPHSTIEVEDFKTFSWLMSISPNPTI